MATPAGAKRPTDRNKPLTAAQRRKAEESAGKWFAAEVGGHTVRVSNPKTWRASTMAQVNRGDILGFAQKVMHPDDYQVFVDVDPTLEETGALVADTYRYFGADRGE